MITIPNLSEYRIRLIVLPMGASYFWRIVLLQWILAPQPDREILKDIEKNFNISKTIATIFYNRGIRSSEDAKQFFKPSWDDLHDPYLMKDMDLAVDRILKAMKYKERVFIYIIPQLNHFF